MGSKTWTIRDLLDVTTDYFKEKGIESPRLNAEILLAHLLNMSRIKLYLHYDQPLTDSEIAGYRSLIRKKIRGEPTQYITGYQEFWSLDFVVGPQVLIPRPESELLVEKTLELCRESELWAEGPAKVLDLGTGCGSLAIAIAKELKDPAIWASDISEEAVSIARKNARRHQVESRIEFLCGDLWQPIKDQGLVFDIILSNPPYILSSDIENLSPDVKDYEPLLALDGKEDGMFYIRRIIAEAPHFLVSGGWLLIPMDPDQTDGALELCKENGAYGLQKRFMDYSHRYRVVLAQKRQ
ncbi:MAG: peptide chain release factor N(5)-glutamine methyltransferase [Deltaproteobacteria bacterium]|nr:peptide chain release factor N(5)-glutamine methyltransferase [Deltaproteobacteria bacterium]